MKEIFFATDERYVPHLSVAIQSMLENGKGPYLIKVINGGIALNDWEKLEAVVEKYEGSRIDSCFFDDRLLDGIKINHHFNKSNYFRLFIPEFTECDKVLYLDSDIVVESNVDEFFNYDIDDYYVAAVENPGFMDHDRLYMSSSADYFNSGVMLINVKKWKIEKIGRRVVDFVNSEPERIAFVDQCGLNAIINGRWLKIPPKYNQQACIFEKNINLSCYIESELEEAKKNPVVIHYTGSLKPWHFSNKHPYKKKYWHYRSKTDYRSYLSDDLNLFEFLKFYTPNFIKETIKKAFK